MSKSISNFQTTMRTNMKVIQLERPCNWMWCL